MKQLSRDWLIESHIDLEYKQFILLAYLENVKKQFHGQFLYPELADLIEHYNNLKHLKTEFSELSIKFPEKLQTIDFKDWKLIYEKIEKNDSLIDELEQIIEFSIPKIKGTLEEGKEIYLEIEQSLKIEPVGIIPLWSDEGYLLIETIEPNETKIFEYSISLFDSANDVYRSLSTKYITSLSRSPFVSLESIKHDLIAKNKELPNPATYFCRTSLSVPFEESYFPVAKRMLIRELSKEKSST
ncbi:MAG: hypothetical protein WED33_11885 [Bacteroidia bacterium]